MHQTELTPRRGFLGRMAAAAAAAGLAWRVPEARAAQVQQQAAPGRWLQGLNGTYKCLFDFPLHGGGLPQAHMRNFIRTHADAFGTAEADIDIVGTLYFVGPQSSQPLAFTDAMWEKYRLGEFMGLTDPRTDRPFIRNMFFRPQPDDPLIGGATVSIEALQGRGATFLTCNNSLTGFASQLADAGRGESDAIREDLLGNLLPGVVLVPAMVIAIERAQAAGFAYNRQ